MKVIAGDCLEVLKTIEDESIDIVFTSPPYNLGNGHHTGNIRHKAYEDAMPEAEYQKWQIEVLVECFPTKKEALARCEELLNNIK